MATNRNERIELYRRMLEHGHKVSNEVGTPPPCDEKAIEALRQDSREKLGEEVPEEFLDFLRVSDGAGFANAGFKRAEHLVLENLDVPRPEVIVLGMEGNVNEIVFDRRDHRYHTIVMGCVNERFESFDTFAELLADLMRRQLRLGPTVIPPSEK
ncbi:MAG: hypothetical protein ACRC7O_09045 [Fimbriiglobus sp.]